MSDPQKPGLTGNPSSGTLPRTLGMGVRCPSCGQAFTAAPLAGMPTLTQCPFCQAIHAVSTLAPADARAAQRLESPRAGTDTPDLISTQAGGFLDDLFSLADESRNGLREETLPDGWRVSVPFFSLARLWKALAWLAAPAALYVAGRFFLPQEQSNSMWSFLPLALTLPGFWYLLVTLLGRTAVEVRGEQGRVSEGLWPLQKVSEFQWADVKQVRAVDLITAQDEDTDGQTRTRREHDSFLQLLGPLLPIELARDVYGGNFWLLRSALQDRIGHP